MLFRSETILNLYGVDSKNTTFIDQTHSIHFDMMEKGELDVGFFLLPANNQFVFKLGTNPNLKIFSLKNSKAIFMSVCLLFGLNSINSLMILKT